MIKYLEYFLGSYILSVSFFIIGNILLDKKEKLNIKNVIITAILSIIIIVINLTSATMLDNILKLIVIFALYIGYYKAIFKEELSKTILTSFIMNLIIFLSEIIVDIILGIILFILKENVLVAMRYSIEINIAISLCAIIISYKERKRLNELVNKGQMDKKILIFLAIIIITALAILLYKTPLVDIKLDLNTSITAFLIVIFCIISFIIIKQQRDVNEKEEEYRKLANYSQVTEGVLEEYRLNLHESRNQLIIIRNMIFTTKKKELKEYVNNLIDATEVNKYRWVNELKYIPIPELKGFINFKLMEMSNKKIDIEINVERKLKSSKMKNLKIKDKGDLYNIIGVFLDNAKEASLESKEKRVAIEMYEIDSDLHIVIANTYKGKIDIEKINEYGYSSKGKNRGTGLHLVNKIIERNRMFERTTSKIDEYFVQELTVHLENVQ